MKSYRELAEKVFERRDKYLAARKKRKKKIIKRTSAALAALVVMFAISAYHLEWFKPDEQMETPTIHVTPGEDYYGPNSNHSGFEILLPTMPPEPEETTIPQTQWQTEPSTKKIWTTYSVPTTFHYVSEITDSGVRVMYVDGDDVHFVYNGKYNVIDTNTAKYRREHILPARPAKMLYRNGEIWASYPTLNAIYIYDYNTFGLKRTIKTPHPVSNFDWYGDYLVYATTTFNDHVYRYNMVTGELLCFESSGQYTAYTADKFTEPGILIDQSNGWVYVGESGTTSCGIFCFNILTMEELMYRNTHAEFTNGSTYMALMDGKLYWSGCEFDADNLSSLLWKKGGRLLRVDERFVYSCGGEVYDRVTKKLVYDDTSYRHEVLPTLCAVTASGNSFKYYDSSLQGIAYLYIVPGEYANY